MDTIGQDYFIVGTDTGSVLVTVPQPYANPNGFVDFALPAKSARALGHMLLKAADRLEGK